MNDNLKKTLANPTYALRVMTDHFFDAEPGSFRYKGEPDRAIRFVEEHQSSNVELWKLFVEQYRIHADAAGGWKGEFWGKMMRGATFVYRYTQNPELYRILTDSVNDLLDAQDDLGRLSTYEKEKEFYDWDMWCRKYILLGLQYYYDICKSAEQKARILLAMIKHCDYIIAHVGEDDNQIPILRTARAWGGLASSSILEPVVRLYNLTGDKKYLNFATYIRNQGGSADDNVFALALRGIAPYRYHVTKAYEMMSFFEGILEYYRVTGDEDCRRAFLRFTDQVLKTDLTVIGSCGCTHELFDNSTAMQTEPSKLIMQETCVTVTLLKLCHQALCLTGNAKYADVVERAYYNAMLGSVNYGHFAAVRKDPDRKYWQDFDSVTPFLKKIGGLTFDSYSPLYKSRRNREIGGFQPMVGNSVYGCCACIGGAGIASLPLESVMHTKDGIVFNHYLKGSFTTKTPAGRPVTFSISTAYPYDGVVKISWNASDESFPIYLRIPGWATKVTLDGKDQPTGAGYVKVNALNRTSLKLELEQPVHTVELNQRIGVEKGCIVYALDDRNQDINVKATKNILSVEPAESEFETRSTIKVTFDNHQTVLMTDYASAGSDWEREGGFVTVWMDR